MPEVSDKEKERELNMTQKEILAEYNKRKSIRATAAALNISTDAVHKTLVGYGVIDTPLTRRIAELRRIGLSQKKIAEMLEISTSCVNKNTPYDRGSYLTPSKSKNAENIRKWREDRRTNNEN